MDALRRVIEDGCPPGAFYYALQPLASSQAPSSRYPKSSNYQLRPNYEPPDAPPGTYKVIYYPTDRPSVPFGPQVKLRIPESASVSREQQRPALNLASLPTDKETTRPTPDELRLQRTQSANDFLTYQFAVAVQRDAHVVARDAYYTSEVKDLLERSRTHSADVQSLSKTLASA